MVFPTGHEPMTPSLGSSEGSRGHGMVALDMLVTKLRLLSLLKLLKFSSSSSLAHMRPAGTMTCFAKPRENKCWHLLMLHGRPDEASIACLRSPRQINAVQRFAAVA